MPSPPYRTAQWLLAILLMLLCFLPLALFFVFLAWVARSKGIEWAVAIAPTYFLLIPLYMPWLQLTSAPLFRLIGIYKYYSPMLVVENPNLKEYHIHGGTNLDYLLHLTWKERGPVAARKTLTYYLEGLLAIADEVEQGILPGDLKIVAASYIFSESTARRLGFTLEEIDNSAKMGLILNYVNLLLKYSYARGRLAFPQLSDMKQASTTGAELVRHRHQIQRLLARLRN